MSCTLHPITCDKGLLKLKNYVQYIFNFLYLKISQLSNCECFLNAKNQLTSSQKKNSSKFLYKESPLLSNLQNGLFFMQLLFKFKGPLLKPKPKKIILNFYFEFFNIHISHLALHFMINMALKWHHKNIFNKITIFIEFWCLPDMFFSLFDCDYTPCGLKIMCLLRTTTKL